jgi:hypothetical protein
MVIIQVDTQEECYVMAMNIKNGQTIWKTPRTELPSWSRRRQSFPRRAAWNW